MPKYDHNCAIALLGHDQRSFELIFRKQALKMASENDSRIISMTHNNGSVAIKNKTDIAYLGQLTNRSRIYLSVHGEPKHLNRVYLDNGVSIQLEQYIETIKQYLTHPTLQVDERRRLRVSLLVCHAMSASDEADAIYNTTIGIAANVYTHFDDPTLTHKRIFCEVVGRNRKTIVLHRHQMRQFGMNFNPPQKLIARTRYKYVEPLSPTRRAKDKFIYTQGEGQECLIYDEDEASAYQTLAHDIITRLNLCIATTRVAAKRQRLLYYVDQLHEIAREILTDDKTVKWNAEHEAITNSDRIYLQEWQRHRVKLGNAIILFEAMLAEPVLMGSGRRSRLGINSLTKHTIIQCYRDLVAIPARLQGM